MSYLGEYVPASVGEPLGQIDRKTRLFRTLRAFPELAPLAHEHGALGVSC